MASKNHIATTPISPPDFYKFKHRTTTYRCPTTNNAWAVASWIVGVSPFDECISLNDGYIVHTEAPKIIARWALGDAIKSVPDNAVIDGYYDEELEILLYEISHLDRAAEDTQEWLLEAVCAVAYSKGIICELEPPAEH